MLTVGLEVPHAHLHLIPINEAKDIDFASPKLSFTKEEFQAIQATIVSAI